MPASKRSEVFDQVWKTVKERYVDPDALKDWAALRQEYEPQALAATSAQAFYDMVAQMVAQLKDGHTYYLSPWAAAERDIIAQSARSKEDIGILYAIDAGTLLVTYVIPDSPADAAGLRRRDRILTIDGQRTTDARLLRGAEGTRVALTVRAPNEATRTVVVRHYEHTQRVLPVAHRLAADAHIGYLHIPTFRPNDMDKHVDNALTELLDGEPLKGLMVDVRSNGGGNRSVTQNILGQFTEGELGRFYMVNRSVAFTVGKGRLLSQLKPIPLAVLIDGRSASASELTSGGLQWQGRARVFGVKSLGSLRVTYFHTMPDGSRLGLSQETFKLPNGFEPDRNGITPDVVLAPNWGDYTERDDPHIIAALKWLQSQRTP
jgi:C-terminal peptidase prc